MPQYEGYLRREETNAAILALSKNGIPIEQIMRQTGHSRKLVWQVIRGERHDVFRTRHSSLDLHSPWLDDQWAAGCRNGAELWRRSKARGSEARSASSASGRRAEDELKRPMRETFRNSVGQNHRAPDDHRPRPAYESGDRHGGGD